MIVVTINLAPGGADGDGVEGVVAEGAAEAGEEHILVEMERTLAQEKGHGKTRISQAEVIIIASGAMTRRWRELEDCREPAS
jgi:hypothetical protein